VNAPVQWLTGNAHLLPEAGTALDVACGSGRHALWLAGQGLQTTAVDRSAERVRALNDEARRRALPVVADEMDLEGGAVRLPPSTFDVVVVVHYLHRPLFPDLIRTLRPGGVLVYETFTRAQAARGKPTNPAFLLEPGELLELVRPLQVLAAREGDYEGRMVASVVARRTGPGV
jgi:SAM-dependent methyltransferase